jgi:hypothetical protein
VTDAAHRNALVDFEYDIERAIADLEVAIANIVGVAEDAEDEVLIRGADGVTRVDATELKGLLARLADAPEEATRAFREFDQEVTRALRTLKQALAREPTEGCRP